MTIHSNKNHTSEKSERDTILYNITRSTCPICKIIIDAQILVHNNKVIMRKRCNVHGWFESLLSSDFESYRYWERFNKPGTIPLKFKTEVRDGCPVDCGLCPSHQQHTCLGILEITQSCNFVCPVCFASSNITAKSSHLDVETVKGMVDSLIRSEGQVELVQLSGGEPTIHPEIIEIVEYIRDTGKISTIMMNSNGRRFSTSPKFCSTLKTAGLKAVYLQFDGFDNETWVKMRGIPDLLPEKMQAISNLTKAGIKIVLTMTVVKGINEHEIGDVIRFMHKTPGISSLAIQPVFAEGRLGHFYDSMDRLTIPDILHLIEDQTDLLYSRDDFFPIPCPHPHCSVCTFSFIDPQTGELTTIRRLVEIEDYLDYFKNSVVPDIEGTIKEALESLFSFSTSPGSQKIAESYCQACGIDLNLESIQSSMGQYLEHVKMISIKPFMSAWDVDVKRLMKCCVHEVLPDGKIIPFCSYNILHRDKYHKKYFQ